MAVPAFPDLSKIPALPAPKGWVTDFNSPVNRAVEYIAVSSIVVPLAFICVVLKLYTKFFVIHRPGWDDCKSKSSTIWHSAILTLFTVASVIAIVR